MQHLPLQKMILPHCAQLDCQVCLAQLECDSQDSALSEKLLFQFSEDDADEFSKHLEQLNEIMEFERFLYVQQQILEKLMQAFMNGYEEKYLEFLDDRSIEAFRALCKK